MPDTTSHGLKKVIDSPEATIYQGDALRVLRALPDCSVDAVLTDPPYSSGGVHLSAKLADPGAKYQRSDTVKSYPALLGDHKDQRSHAYWSTLWLAECWRVTKDGGAILLFSDWRMLPTMSDALQSGGWSWRGVVPWHKPSSRPNRGRFRQSCEFVLFGSRGAFAAASDECLPGLYTHSIVHQDKVHLTGKPVALIADLLAVTPQGATVLDPFMGGGTTALAAIKTGRKSIGIELSAEYAAIASGRVREALHQRSLLSLAV